MEVEKVREQISKMAYKHRKLFADSPYTNSFQLVNVICKCFKREIIFMAHDTAFTWSCVKWLKIGKVCKYGNSIVNDTMRVDFEVEVCYQWQNKDIMRLKVKPYLLYEPTEVQND